MCPTIDSISNLAHLYPSPDPDYDESTSLIHGLNDNLNHNIDDFIQLIENSKRKMLAQNKPRNIINIIHNALTALYYIISFQREKNVSNDKNIFNENNIYISKNQSEKCFSRRESELSPYYKEFMGVILGGKDKGVIYFDESNTDRLEINMRYEDLIGFIDIAIVDKNESKKNITSIKIGESGVIYEFNERIGHNFSKGYVKNDGSDGVVENNVSWDNESICPDRPVEDNVSLDNESICPDRPVEDNVSLDNESICPDRPFEYNVSLDNESICPDRPVEDNVSEENVKNSNSEDISIYYDSMAASLQVNRLRIVEKNKGSQVLFTIINDFFPEQKKAKRNTLAQDILYEIICTGNTYCRNMTAEMDEVFFDITKFIDCNVAKNKLYPSLNDKGIENIEKVLLQVNAMLKVESSQILFELSQLFYAVSSTLYLGSQHSSVTPLRMYATALLEYAIEKSKKEYKPGLPFGTKIRQQLMSIFYERGVDGVYCAQQLSHDMKNEIIKLDKVFFELPAKFR
ncbi:hypothetical protein [Escherichia coli]|uniref:hypothetical protein n=1 Tax=Escherichia coli TaxID=562 RepID=UPI00136557CE|nr:hypothetical protein [Escherichia coli]MWT74187.1 hypothetical protein [Escherichia coli]